jgi:uncharacterized ferritin-like protein (DUF455 family)
VDSNLFEAVGEVLYGADLEEKLVATERLYRQWRANELVVESVVAPRAVGQAGHPQRPELVPPRQLKRRRLGSPKGHASMLHAIAHIEFNAINLALDAVYRFREMPQPYYDDWLRIADEERYHFQLVQGRLNKLGYAYGDFPAHNGLWEVAQQSADDLLLRMGLVPRILEARGLDVNPGIMEKLEAIGDEESVALLKVILRDEVGHVKAGTVWFRYLCEQRGVESEATFEQIVRDHARAMIRGPFYKPGRLEAGFSAREMALLEALEQERHGAERKLPER